VLQPGKINGGDSWTGHSGSVSLSRLRVDCTPYVTLRRRDSCICNYVAFWRKIYGRPWRPPHPCCGLAPLGGRGHEEFLAHRHAGSYAVNNMYRF